MDKQTRLARLCLLIEAAGGKVDGRKKLHKLAYLCERAGTDLGQGFVWHMFGVYSPSLALDLEAAEKWEYITERAQAGGGYEISLRHTIDHLRCGLPTRTEPVCNWWRISQASRRRLSEVVTTIVYLWDSGYRDQKLREKLRDLKGHLSSQFSRAFSLGKTSHHS